MHLRVVWNTFTKVHKMLPCLFIYYKIFFMWWHYLTRQNYLPPYKNKITQSKAQWWKRNHRLMDIISHRYNLISISPPPSYLKKTLCFFYEDFKLNFNYIFDSDLFLYTGNLLNECFKPVLEYKSPFEYVFWCCEFAKVFL